MQKIKSVNQKIAPHLPLSRRERVGVRGNNAIVTSHKQAISRVPKYSNLTCKIQPLPDSLPLKISVNLSQLRLFDPGRRNHAKIPLE
jgi:hypothetical protein